MLEEIKEKLKKNIKYDRYIHSINVMNTAISLARLYNVDENKAALAGILHDCAKDFQKEDAYELYERFISVETDEIKKSQPGLLHGFVGAYVAETYYGIKDKEILNAIKFHTTGKENMNMLEKIIIISDYIEPGRNFSSVDDIRKLATKDIDSALVRAFDSTIRYVVGEGDVASP